MEERISHLFSQLTDLMTEGFYVITDHRFEFVNPVLADMLQSSPKKLIGRPFVEFVHPDQRDQVVAYYSDRIQGKPAPQTYQIELQPPGCESPTTVEVDVRTLSLDEYTHPLVIGIVRSAKSYLSLQNELEETREQLNSILGNMSDTVYQTNMTGEVTFISRSVEQLLGYKAEEMVGSKLADYYWSPEERQKVVQAIVDNDGVITNVEAILRRREGSPLWISTNAYVKKNEAGEPVSIEGIARDVTRQKELEQRLEHLALTDSLTTLPNRRALMDELHESFAVAKATGQPLSLAYFDINGFKTINDRFGHLVGDQLLRHIARILPPLAAEGQSFGRLSGDEFLFILPKSNVDAAWKLGRELLKSVQENPLLASVGTVECSISVGVSELNGDDKNEFSLLDRADKAMYLAKKSVSNLQIL
jgi:diguanylate cyclase (GGDEF)-like protein/PAS domain S-box-containing protein